ncbi:DUF982 domain-containing protein [Sinorhizobium meliloti]|nr:DUF982 domain-containing protein [Sinorhizobium meliloti]
MRSVFMIAISAGVTCWRYRHHESAVNSRQRGPAPMFIPHSDVQERDASYLAMPRLASRGSRLLAAEPKALLPSFISNRQQPARLGVMHCFWWDKSVELELGTEDKYRDVKSTREAVECLLQRWPRRDGPALAAAKRVCLQALDGKVKTERARRAFIKAAEEAHISIRSH